MIVISDSEEEEVVALSKRDQDGNSLNEKHGGEIEMDVVLSESDQDNDSFNDSGCEEELLRSLRSKPLVYYLVTCWNISFVYLV